LGTARKASIISDGDNYLGHVNEPTHPLIIVEGLRWINSTLDGTGIELNFTNIQQENVFTNLVTIQKYINIIYLGIIASIIPLLWLFVSFFKYYKLLKFSKSNSDGEESSDEAFIECNFFEKYPISKYFLIFGINIAFSCIFMWGTKYWQIKWLPISVGPELFAIFLGTLVANLIIYLIIHFRKQFSFTIQFNKQKIFLGIISGIILGIWIPFLFQCAFTWQKLPNFIGEFPLSFRRNFLWLFLSVIIVVSYLPVYSWIEVLKKGARRIKYYNGINLICIVIYFGSIIITAFLLGFSIITIAFVIGFLYLIVLFQVIASFLNHYFQNVLPLILMAGILTSWAIINFLPYQN
jgi:hypothetical protein